MEDKELIEKIERNGDHIVVSRMQQPAFFSKADAGEEVLIGAVVDTETTGLTHGKDKIIEVGILKFEFSREGQIFRVLGSLDRLEDPGMPIPQEVVDLTGINDEMVKGERIDDEEVEAFMKDVVLVLAHNSSFDRPFLDERFPLFQNLSFGCTNSQIPWAKEGIGGSKLIYLAYEYRFFYGAHRAIDDCWAVLNILSKTLPKSGEGVFVTLLETARKDSCLIEAKSAPFEAKDQLKGRKYHWNPSKRVWEKEILFGELEEEEGWLKENIYDGELPALPKKKVTPVDRFKLKS